MRLFGCWQRILLRVFCGRILKIELDSLLSRSIFLIWSLSSGHLFLQLTWNLNRFKGALPFMRRYFFVLVSMFLNTFLCKKKTLKSEFFQLLFYRFGTLSNGCTSTRIQYLHKNIRKSCSTVSCCIAPVTKQVLLTCLFVRESLKPSCLQFCWKFSKFFKGMCSKNNSNWPKLSLAKKRIHMYFFYFLVEFRKNFARSFETGTDFRAPFEALKICRNPLSSCCCI